MRSMVDFVGCKLQYDYMRLMINKLTQTIYIANGKKIKRIYIIDKGS